MIVYVWFRICFQTNTVHPQSVKRNANVIAESTAADVDLNNFCRWWTRGSWGFEGKRLCGNRNTQVWVTEMWTHLDTAQKEKKIYKCRLYPSCALKCVVFLCPLTPLHALKKWVGWLTLRHPLVIGGWGFLQHMTNHFVRIMLSQQTDILWIWRKKKLCLVDVMLSELLSIQGHEPFFPGV